MAVNWSSRKSGGADRECEIRSVGLGFAREEVGILCDARTIPKEAGSDGNLNLSR